MTSKIFKRTMVIEGKSITLGVIFVSLCFLNIFTNIFLILVIVWKRHLWQVRFYIIGNLAVADIVGLLIFFIN